MRSLMKRVEALEGKAAVVSPAVKRWLGWPLTEAEQVAADAHDTDLSNIDTSNWSQEVKTWLGVA